MGGGAGYGQSIHRESRDVRRTDSACGLRPLRIERPRWSSAGVLGAKGRQEPMAGQVWQGGWEAIDREPASRELESPEDREHRLLAEARAGSAWAREALE